MLVDQALFDEYKSLYEYLTSKGCKIKLEQVYISSDLRAGIFVIEIKKSYTNSYTSSHHSLAELINELKKFKKELEQDKSYALEEVTNDERTRLLGVFEDKQKIIETSGRNTWIIFDNHRTAMVPHFKDDLDAFLDNIKYYLVIKRESHFLIFNRSEDSEVSFEFNVGSEEYKMSSEEVLNKIRKAVLKKVE